MRIDAHQHFWQFDPIRDSWMTEGVMNTIRRDFLPQDLQPILQKNKIDGCVAVQADQSETETYFLLELAKQHDFIKGVIGWVDLKSPTLESRLEHFKQYPKLKGFRHILQGEKPEYMLESHFINGIKMLEKYDFSYDILVFPKHLKAVKSFLQKFDNQRFVIDHLAKPYIKKGFIKGWERDMRHISKHHPNVFCKISGMVTEANWEHWKECDFEPYLDVIFEAFGVDRLMYGSDWPVCLLAVDYEKQLSIIKNYCKKLSNTEGGKIMGENAVKYYKLT
jgi:L-fuconolactonase